MNEYGRLVDRYWQMRKGIRWSCPCTRSRSTAPSIINVGTPYSWVFRLTPWPLYPRYTCTKCPSAALYEPRTVQAVAQSLYWVLHVVKEKTAVHGTKPECHFVHHKSHIAGPPEPRCGYVSLSCSHLRCTYAMNVLARANWSLKI